MDNYDEFLEKEWQNFVANHSGVSVNDLIIDTDVCNGMCNDCMCGALEDEFISHPPKKDEAQARKNTPVFSGVLNYFPDAIKAVAQCSFIGNEQHNPNTPLHWDRSKSGDEKDALVRHLLDAGTIDTDGIRHSAKVAWRSLANLQKEIENEKG